MGKTTENNPLNKNMLEKKSFKCYIYPNTVHIVVNNVVRSK